MNNALLKELPAKGALVKVCYDEPRYGTVISVLSKEETKEIGMMGQAIRLFMSDTGKEEDFYYGWEAIEEKIRRIANELEIPEDTMEPTDNQGYSYDAICKYRDKEYSVHLAAFSNRMFPEQAAEQIYQQLHQKNVETEQFLETYALASIEGKGVHVGRIKGHSLDANDVPVIEVDIDLLSSTNVQHPNIMTSEKMKEIEGYLKRVESVLAKHTESQSDDFAYGLRLCDCIKTIMENSCDGRTNH